MAYPFVGAKQECLELEAYEVHPWPIVRAYAERLGLVGVINRLVPSEMEIDAGTIVLGLVIDTLSGRSPLYHLEAFVEHQDRALLLGHEVEAKVFNDDTVGRVLERLFEVGTQKMFSALSLAAVQRFAIPLKHVHHDTTSVTLYGDYLPMPGKDPSYWVWRVRNICAGSRARLMMGGMIRRPARSASANRCGGCARARSSGWPRAGCAGYG